MMLTEADTCRTLIAPKLYAARWTDDQIREQVTFTDGRIVPAGKRVIRKNQRRADYILRYSHDYPIAVVEAKAENVNAFDGLQQEVAYLDGLPSMLRFEDLRQAKVNALRELQSASWERSCIR